MATAAKLEIGHHSLEVFNPLTTQQSCISFLNNVSKDAALTSAWGSLAAFYYQFQYPAMVFLHNIALKPQAGPLKETRENNSPRE